jgi:hypothetical protein
VGESSHKMTVSDKVVTVGSCFADVIGQKLQESKVETTANPFGNVYNPLSIHKLLHYANANQLPPRDTFLRHEGIFLNFDFHSEIFGTSEEELAKRMAAIIANTGNALKHARWLVITYGTAWVYTRNENGMVVANCHRMPGTNFSKSILTSTEIESSFAGFYHELKELNPLVRVILTVSPVRHVKDTLALNSVSKATLITACFNIARKFSDVQYFPAYEIMMDDLRDYRFYQPDMLHPSAVAEDYIWKKFITSYFTKGLQDLLKQYDDIRLALNHKPFHPDTAAHRNFLRQTLNKLNELADTINVEPEINRIKQQLDQMNQKMPS